VTGLMILRKLPTVIFRTLKDAFDSECGLIASRRTWAWTYRESTNVKNMCRKETNRYTQYTLSVTQLQMVFMFTIRKTGLVHNVRTDVVSPQKCCDFESLTEIPRLVGNNIYIAPPGAPKTKRSLLLEKVLHRNCLVRRQGNEDLL
jgi:hypothetical protein